MFQVTSNKIKIVVFVVVFCIILFYLSDFSNSPSLNTSTYAAPSLAPVTCKPCDDCKQQQPAANSCGLTPLEKNIMSCIRKNYLSVTDWIRCVLRGKGTHDPISFIQLGANDGKMLDPLNPIIEEYRNLGTDQISRWRGLLLEPVPWIMKRLKETTYAHMNSQFAFLEAAISDVCKNKTISFYVIPQNKIQSDSDWKSGIGGINPEDSYKQYMEIITVPCVTINDLYAQYKNHIKNLDILLIDLEGFDGRIIHEFRHWPFGRPLIVTYEVLGVTSEHFLSRQIAVTTLTTAGYMVIATGANDVAIDMKTIIEKLGS